MRSTILILLAALTFSATSHAGCATPPVPDARIRQGYPMWRKVLASSPAQQQKLWQANRRTFASREAMLQFARSYLAIPVARRIFLEHVYRDNCNGRLRQPSVPSYPDRIDDSGVCYSGPNCMGSGRSVSHGTQDCSSADRAFAADHGGCSDL